MSWAVQVILTLAAIALVAAGWQAVTLAVLLIRQDPSQVWFVLGCVVAATVASLWAGDLTRVATRARKLEKRVAALEKSRDLMIAAGAEQQRELERFRPELQRRSP